MNDSDSLTKPPPNDEARMRRALGLDRASSEGRPQQRDADRRTRRFVKDGDIPVVFVTTPRDKGTGTPISVNRIAAAEIALKAERAAREQAERSLHEAQATIQQLQTKLGHADLAHREALAAERHERERLERALQGADATRAALEARIAELRVELENAELERPEPVRDAVSIRPSSPASAPRARLKATPVEPSASEPVQWWLPGYKARTRNR